VSMSTLLLQGPDNALYHAVLFWRIRRDELLLQAVTLYQRPRLRQIFS